ncbi:aspartate-semialdehyde dehydrogenase [Pontibacter sp. G13]|uniref:aspartate-semialdehyde dehydrogenase n=1 Tax=Pontibacter sp. G13 TaxID=3074898 RepID=UPI00288A9655|nr:aspartate-semialdehyde dehydrogenase [Pontibacter sp. G13]WNJ20362.1 aspartate-semialdehyde dehydrogenase [Pontibacter sp. G13]
MKVAVVGATGLVGTQMMKVLEEMSFPVSELIPVASAKSAGKQVTFQGKQWTVVGMEDGIAARPDFALFSAGGSTSKAWAPKFVEVGTIVIDNSSAWRMDPNVPLVVPEVNLDAAKGSKLIANPNCSTIQMMLALAPIHRKYGIKRLVISTYQSVTGTGKAAVDQLFGEREGKDVEAVYPQKIDLNVLPHCDIFLDNDYTKEEMKMVHETRKILGDDDIRITATAVRVPVIGGHSESINIETEQPFEIEDIKQMLADSEGVILKDNPAELSYPTLLDAADRNEVFVGRIRRDDSIDNGLNLWCVADNLRKGAATNAVQIAQALIKENA